MDRLLGDRRFGDVVRCHGSCHSSLANLSLDTPTKPPLVLVLSSVSLPLEVLVLFSGLTSFVSCSLVVDTGIVLSFFLMESFDLGFGARSLSFFLSKSLLCFVDSLFSRRRSYFLLIRLVNKMSVNNKIIIITIANDYFDIAFNNQ